MTVEIARAILLPIGLAIPPVTLVLCIMYDEKCKRNGMAREAREWIKIMTLTFMMLTGFELAVLMIVATRWLFVDSVMVVIR